MSTEARPVAVEGGLVAITITAMLASLVAFIDIAIINVALSDIRASFGTPLDQIGWISTSYMMANIVVIPLTGWFQRRFGFRRYFTASILLFTLASLLCGLAWSLPALIAFRAIQGLGGGAIIPTSQALLFLRYPAAKHGTAAALIGLGSITGPLVAPWLGGMVIELSSWHWIFLINLPMGLVAAGVGWHNIRDANFAPARDSLDVEAMSLMACGLVSLQYVLEEGARDDWFESPVITTLSLVSLACLTRFVFTQLSCVHPILNFRLLRSASYAAATTLNFLVGICVFAAAFVFALFCGTVMRYSALETGTLLMQGNVSLLLLMPIMAKLSRKVDGRALISLGVCILVCSLWMNSALTSQVPREFLLRSLTVRAFGMALVFVPLMSFALSDVPAAEAGNASAMFSLTRELGGSIGTAWLSTVIDRRSVQIAGWVGRQVDVFNPVTWEQLEVAKRQLASRVYDAELAALEVTRQRLMRESLVSAFSEAFACVALLFVGSAWVILLLKKATRDQTSAGMH